MKNNKILIYFLIAGILHLSAVLYQIARYEIILKTGEPYKVRTAPVDPHDFFRGKYLALRYDNTTAPVKNGDNIQSGSRAYVSLSKDKDGFAIFTELSSKPPKDRDYLRVDAASGNRFNLPYNRFYMEESISQAVEELYFKYSQRGNWLNSNNYALLRVKGGRAVIEDLYINGIQMRKLVESDEKLNK
ncbi:MAG: GDYXXLXY domain-containing protein [Verrucomicrobiia bacterium]